MVAGYMVVDSDSWVFSKGQVIDTVPTKRQMCGVYD